MRKLIVSSLVSFDGIRGDPQSWAGDYFGEQAAEESLAVLPDSDAMLMGRNTYQYFASASSSPSGPYLERISQLAQTLLEHGLPDGLIRHQPVIAAAGPRCSAPACVRTCAWSTSPSAATTWSPSPTQTPGGPQAEQAGIAEPAKCSLMRYQSSDPTRTRTPLQIRPPRRRRAGAARPSGPCAGGSGPKTGSRPAASAATSPRPRAATSSTTWDSAAFHARQGQRRRRMDLRLRRAQPAQGPDHRAPHPQALAGLAG